MMTPYSNINSKILKKPQLRIAAVGNLAITGDLWCTVASIGKSHCWYFKHELYPLMIPMQYREKINLFFTSNNRSSQESP